MFDGCRERRVDMLSSCRHEAEAIEGPVSDDLQVRLARTKSRRMRTGSSTKSISDTFGLNVDQ
jgi:hypothetical protein